MKVVLFCGGLGMRIRDYSDKVPKPMVPIGYRPILWNIMKYYAHYGHKEFILCLGHKADLIKDYFINYKEYISNDFVFTSGGNSINLLNKDIEDWKITFVDTGISANIGSRFLKIKKFLEKDEMFLVNYSDGLTNLNLPHMIEDFKKKDKIATFMSYQPTQSFHVVSLKENGNVKSISHIGDSGLWINAGYFIFKREIFDYIKKGEDLVNEPFQRLIDISQLDTYKFDGFWASMDTFKDKQTLDDKYTAGIAPWQVWDDKK